MYMCTSTQYVRVAETSKGGDIMNKKERTVCMWIKQCAESRPLCNDSECSMNGGM